MVVGFLFHKCSSTLLSSTPALKLHKLWRERAPTFCGERDAGTGDCDLMFLAGEPVKETDNGQ